MKAFLYRVCAIFFSHFVLYPDYRISFFIPLAFRFADYRRSKELNLQFILGYAISPLMWLIGIAPQDMIHAGSLLGQKIIMTEFIGYVDLANLKAAGAFAQTKSVIMCTYFLCGFANFASIGIQIGGIGGLTPKNKPLLAQFGMRALLAGTLASLLSATVVGMIIG